MRLRDPVYGCVGVISLLQHQLRQLQLDLTCAKSELSKYQTTLSSNHHHHHHALLSNHQSLAAGINNLYHHQFFPREPHHQMLRGFDSAANGYDAASLLAMNVAGINGPLSSQFHQPRAAAGDDRRNIDRS
ncbi:hypothetical protein MLD38_005970 [Melastoma candidum]|uniref:Uncharacterized protein n=1 Tax=Melastoma candidum TaxID=119954 RepID=A0ACB9RL49_9MYRT|nr:hypothetical protein MLD38_005970 [Melastoma candidum]